MAQFFDQSTQQFRVRVLSILAPLYVRWLLRNIVVEYESPSVLGRLEALHRADTPIVFAFHHGQLIPLVLYAIWAKRHAVLEGLGGICVLTSAAEGAVAGRILQREGLRYITRESPIKKANIRAVNKACVQILAEGSNLALSAEDRHGAGRSKAAVKSGACKFAAEAGAVLVPISASVASGRTFLWWNWDRMLIPLPWWRCRIVVRMGEPIEEATTDADRRLVARTLQAKLDQATEDADGKASDILHDQRVGLFKAILSLAFLMALLFAAMDPLSVKGGIGLAATLATAVGLIIVTRGYYSRVVPDATATVLEVVRRTHTLEKYSQLLSRAGEEVLILHRGLNPHFFLDVKVFDGLRQAVGRGCRVNILLRAEKDLADVFSLMLNYQHNDLLNVCFADGEANLTEFRSWVKDGEVRMRWTPRRYSPTMVLVDSLHVGLDIPQDTGTPFSPRRADFLFESRGIATRLRREFEGLFNAATPIRSIDELEDLNHD